MRKSWTIRRDGKAVSPVIATILMVAITVVLAAVLYVMVTGLLGGGTQTTPQITVNSPTSVASGTWEMSIAGVSDDHALSAYQVQVLNGTTEAIAATDLDAVKASPKSGGGLTLSFIDVGGAGSDKLTGGDALRLAGTSSGNTYKVLIIWKASGDVVHTANIG